MVLEYNRKIYRASFTLLQTTKLELPKIQWILCYGLIAILRVSSVIILSATAKDIFNLVENALITNVSTQTVTNGLNEI